VVVEINRELQEQHLGVDELKVSPTGLAELLRLLDAGKLNNITAKEVFRGMAESGEDALTTAKKLNKLIEQDESVVDDAIAEVINEYRDKAVADYLGGEKKVLGFLVGQAMRKMKGKANPKELGAKFEEALARLKS
jgi:aspartyl-tRNA(Asn)/glutamyl-tRNA(Gln) amidotransferase subunit B